jgi:tRNA-2-methylthio-N6-dimethylallyladenosine synthase
LTSYKIVTYGCQMNVHDSEKIAGLLDAEGYVAAKDGDADIIVFNTCCIRDTAERKALGNIGKLKKIKAQNPNLIIAVAGCLSQQEGAAELFKKKYPHVDIVLGTKNIGELPKRIKESQTSKVKFLQNLAPDDFLETDENAPMTRESYPNAWINIIYGCNNFCSYCIVPYVRGREISRKIHSVLDEVKRCLNDGFREITLLGQNVNSYGNDLKDGTSFAKLLSEIDKIEGKFRVRFMTSHPKDFNAEIVDVMAGSDKICKHIHLPVQAGSDKVLSDMNRRYTKERYLSLVELIRKKMPDCGITSDIMVGYPTETEEDFLETLDLVRRARFSAAFTFIFSPRRGTPAEKLPQLTEEVKKDRITRLIALQNSVTKEISKAHLGNVYEILVEGAADGFAFGRTDGGRLVSFPSAENLLGRFVKVKITSAKISSLSGELV